MRQPPASTSSLHCAAWDLAPPNVIPGGHMCSQLLQPRVKLGPTSLASNTHGPSSWPPSSGLTAQKVHRPLPWLLARRSSRPGGASNPQRRQMYGWFTSMSSKMQRM